MSSLMHCLGGEGVGKVRSARVLVVGAGGIGCELLKNLVMTGFRDIETIDLDTIDLSNLNRQFLFRKEHIGQSKAKIARESVLRFNPDCKITAHHGNIKDPKFDGKFFKQFDLVLNALDNLGARQHVNRMCLATKRPLIESGTQGYLGQVVPIIPGKTKCFECDPQPSQTRTYAACTLRDTPDKPVHCVVYAKHVLNVLFGPVDEDDPWKDLGVTDPFDKELRPGDEPFERRAFRKFFNDDIKRALANKEDWGARKPPQTVDLDAVLSAPADAASGSGEPLGLRDQTVLPVADNVWGFLKTVKRFVTERKGDVGALVFDKEDDLAMDFVAYTSNLRMHAYHIPTLSRFAVKGIAGNIVHAIASANAIVAGIIVLEALKILRVHGNSKPKVTWMSKSGPRLLQPQSLDPPRDGCIACGEATVGLTVYPADFTLAKLYALLRDKVGMIEPAIDNRNGDGAYYGTEDENGPQLLNRPFDKLPSMADSALLAVEDDEQQLNFQIIVSFAAEPLDEKEHPKGYILDMNGDALEKARMGANAAELKLQEAPGPSSKRPRSTDDGVVVLDDDDPVVIVGEESRNGPSRKRAKR